MILVIDNYDSFTYNLVQLIGSFEPEIVVVRNDQCTVADIAAQAPSGIVISPGPGRPENAGICVELIRRLGLTIPILGVCLGHQAIGLAYGGTITYAPTLMHGKTSEIHHNGAEPFGGLPSPFPATRYHSLVISPQHLPPDLEVIATTSDGTIMAVQHRKHPVTGIQFHPESILTPAGRQIVANWLRVAQPPSAVSSSLLAVSPSVPQQPQQRNGKDTAEGGCATPAMKTHLQTLCRKVDLTREQARDAMRTIMEGRATAAQIGSFLVAMKLKGETPDEILGFVDVMRERCRKVRLDDPSAVDLCGTGGDGSGTFNISTAASFVVAGAGVTVAKHGNRSVSSSCGSSDVLRELGVHIELPPEKVESCINGIGIGFLFAPLFHESLRHAAGPRAELGMRTCFNLLGPLTNPAGVRRQLVGAYDHAAAKLMAEVFARLDAQHVYVVHSDDGLDEISLSGRTRVLEIGQERSVVTYEIDSKSMGLPGASAAAISGSSPQENARTILAILGGQKGPKRDVTVANAAYAIMASGKCDTLPHAVAMAEESIDSGKALAKLNSLRNLSNA